MKKALILIDYVYDFVADEGHLTCGIHGQVLESYIYNEIKKAMENNDYLVIANDAHELNDVYHPETMRYPSHCIKDTKGVELYGKIKDLVRLYPKDKCIQIDKTRFSAFAGTSLDIKLRERQITNIELMGVCTDICVLHTAVDGYNLNYKIAIHQNGVASFDQEAHEFALKHMEQVIGAKLL